MLLNMRIPIDAIVNSIDGKYVKHKIFVASFSFNCFLSNIFFIYTALFGFEEKILNIKIVVIISFELNNLFIIFPKKVFFINM